jgi:hypothetical protein
MASVNEFALFDNLNDDLKLKIIEKMSGSKDLLNFMASGVSGQPKLQVQDKLKALQSESFHKLINTLYRFTYDCVGAESKFSTDEELRNRHLDLFISGYTNTQLLEDDANFKHYNSTFEDLLDDLCHELQNPMEFYTDYEKRCLLAEVMNRLRLRKDLNEMAKLMLFKKVEDDAVEHKLDIQFESGVNLSIIILLSNQADSTMPYIDVEAQFYVKHKNKSHKTKYVISDEDDEEDEEGVITTVRTQNDPIGWVVPFLLSLRKTIGKKHVLGEIKNMDYTYNGVQFWLKAYMLLEVLPKLS